MLVKGNSDLLRAQACVLSAHQITFQNNARLTVYGVANCGNNGIYGSAVVIVNSTLALLPIESLTASS